MGSNIVPLWDIIPRGDNPSDTSYSSPIPGLKDLPTFSHIPLPITCNTMNRLADSLRDSLSPTTLSWFSVHKIFLQILYFDQALKLLLDVLHQRVSPIK
jgi:hypothetical protein